MITALHNLVYSDDAAATRGPEGSSWSAPRHHAMSLMCDDLRSTMEDLAARGATFTTEPTDHGYGITVMMAVPGADDIQLYEPRHTTAFDL